MASDILKFLDDKNLDKVQMVGHSMGGRAVFQFCFLFPERVERLASVDVSPLSAVSNNTASAFIQYVNSMQKAIEAPEIKSGSLPLHEARKKVDEDITHVVQDKFIRDFLMMNLVKSESNSQLIWKFNLPAIRDMLAKNYINQLEHQSMQYNGKSLFVYGEHSNYMRESEFGRIKELFPRAKFHKILDAGHYLHVQKQKEFLDVLIPFLK
jgi:pimeloyl-ACP methyl ester carboxylesterase